MISAKPVTNIEKQANQASNSDEKELKTDDFSALLNGLCAVPVPVDLPVQKNQTTEAPESSIDLKEGEADVNSIINAPEGGTPPGLNEQSLPVNIKDLFRLDGKAEVDFLSKFKLEDKNKSNALVEDQLVESFDPLKIDGDKTPASDAGDITAFEVITDEPAAKTDIKDLLAGNRLPEPAAAFSEEKPVAANKLPKLFSEVAGLLEVHNPNLQKDQQVTNPPLPAASAEKAFIEQIEPRLLELAVITARTSEKQVLKMKLHPAELGMVEIKIEKGRNGKLTAFFQTETESAKQILTKNLEELRDSLQNSGWQIEHMEISSGASNSSNGFENRENPARQTETAEVNVKTLASGGNSNHQDDLQENLLNRLLSLRA